jgi:predicted alpha-1,6-mannanase (GH76 family)
VGKRLLARLNAAVVGLGMLAGVTVLVGHAEAATSTAAASVGVLMHSYDADSGRIGGGWWTGAVALSTALTYRQNTGDHQYDYAISGALTRNRNFTHEYIDDTGWWALSWLQAYDATGNQQYLSMAETTTDYMHQYWDGTCGGGVYWSTAKAYKASIANELFLAATAGLHNRLPADNRYQGWAQQEWSWFAGSGLISGNLVRDGPKVSGYSVNPAEFTYNQGVVLQGLTELARASGNTGLLTTAASIASAATQKFNHNGVLYEGCEPNCTGDGQAFNGIFIRYLRALATATATAQYDQFISTTANSILANDTDNAGRQGDSFVGPFAQWATAPTPPQPTLWSLRSALPAPSG